MPMTLTGNTRKAFLLFFSSHIVITLLIDGQAILPKSIFPNVVVQTFQWYTLTYKDELMTSPVDLWLKSFITCEFLFQLPFFVIATYALLNAQSIDGKGWFRSLCLIYGAHTSTTLIPILTYIILNHTITVSERLLLSSFYLPYIIFPLWLTIIAFVSEDVFGKENSSHSKKE